MSEWSSGGGRDAVRPTYELASTDNLDVLLAVLPVDVSEALGHAAGPKGTTISSRSSWTSAVCRKHGSRVAKFA